MLVVVEVVGQGVGVGLGLAFVIGEYNLVVYLVVVFLQQYSNLLAIW